MKLSSYDPFTRAGRFIVQRFALSEFNAKRGHKLSWCFIAITLACAIRYWKYGDYLFSVLTGTVAFLTYWRIGRFGVFRCSRCRHIKGPEDLGHILHGDLDGPDPLVRGRFWLVLAVFVYSCIALVWGALAAAIVPVLGFTALGIVDCLISRRYIDADAEKECCSCEKKFEEIDALTARAQSGVDSIQEGIALILDSNFPSERPPIAAPARSESESEHECVP